MRTIASLSTACLLALSTPVVFADDLPIQPTHFGAKPTSAPIETPEASEDPRDVPAPTFFGEEIDVTNDSLIYVIDISGSMTMATEPFEDENGKIVPHGTRLDRAKAELKRSIGGLPENFTFNVFVYDECVKGCWPAKRAATTANKTTAFGWVDALKPEGWTNTGLALQTALADKQNSAVVLLSDGAPNFLDCAARYVASFDDHARLVRSSNTQQARIDTFGIGISGDPTTRAFMQRLASESGGTYRDVN